LAIFLNRHFIILISIPPSIHNCHLKYLEINYSLFSQEEQIHTDLQEHLERLNSVPNSLQMSPRNHFLILSLSPFHSQISTISGLLTTSRSLWTLLVLRDSPRLSQIFATNGRTTSLGDRFRGHRHRDRHRHRLQIRFSHGEREHQR
jgi:hypothetical protein